MPLLFVATEQSPSVCEYWAVACLCQMMSHDYHTIINSAKQGTCIANCLNLIKFYDWIFCFFVGLSKISSTPQMLKDTLQRVFQLVL